MSASTENQMMALAGVIQAGYLVDRLANFGESEGQPFEASIASIFALDPQTTAEVYGGAVGVRRGLQLLRDMLSGQERESQANVIRYVINLVQLERKLGANREMLAILRSRLEQASEQARHFEPTHENVLANLDGIYQDTLSTLPMRIQVKGEATQLRTDAVAHKVRALLLAGIRSAMLWHQLGGRRWHLLLRRRQLQDACDALLEA